MLTWDLLHWTFAKAAGIQSTLVPLLNAGLVVPAHLDRLPNPDDMDAQANQGRHKVVNGNIGSSTCNDGSSGQHAPCNRQKTSQRPGLPCPRRSLPQRQGLSQSCSDSLSLTPIQPPWTTGVDQHLWVSASSNSAKAHAVMGLRDCSLRQCSGLYC